MCNLSLDKAIIRWMSDRQGAMTLWLRKRPANYDGDRYPPMVKPDAQDWELVDRRWQELLTDELKYRSPSEISATA